MDQILVKVPGASIRLALERSVGRPAPDRASFLLQALLAQFSGGRREEWNIDHDGNGAPCARRAGVKQEIFVSISRSYGITAVCMSQCPVGLDVEHISAHESDTTLAQSLFSQAEQDFLRASPPEEYRHGFFRIWTLKEAYVKARGLGFRVEPASFSVATPGKLPFLCPPPGDSSGYRLHSRILPTGHALALASAC